MKIISYNVNGIRAAMRKGLANWLQSVDADVIGFQEIKAQEEQIDQEALKKLGYEYQYWYPAQKKGYSGVGIISKIKPQHVEYGTGIDYMDFEGRNIRIDFPDFSFMSMYLPSGTNMQRLQFKFKYMADILKYASNLKRQMPNLLISGDYNICHEAIDIHDPIRLQHVSGFLPEERIWLSRFMNEGFIDSFRKFNKQPHQYTWWSYRAASRQRNKGWRIDYHLATENLMKNVNRSIILPEAKHSDHCPILIDIKF